MAGRDDYYERLENKKERLNTRIEKSQENQSMYGEKQQKILDAIPMGQPILTDHYSANRHRNDLKRVDNYMRHYVEEGEKIDHYQSKLDNIEKIENEKIISSDDPKAVEKLKNRLERLEEQRKQIKAREHYTYELTNIGAEIRRTKDRIKQIETLENLNYEEKNFDKFRAFVNKDINRVVIEFKSRVTNETYKYMRSVGFLYSKTEKAFVRKFNSQGISALNRAVKHLNDKKVLLENDEGQEM